MKSRKNIPISLAMASIFLGLIVAIVLNVNNYWQVALFIAQIFVVLPFYYSNLGSGIDEINRKNTSVIYKIWDKSVPWLVGIYFLTLIYNFLT